MNRALAPLLLALLSPVAAAQIPFVELGSADLTPTTLLGTPEYIGSDPGCIAWDGTRLFVGGFNNTLAGTPCGIVEITNVLSAAPLISPAFAVQATSSFRSYANLDVENDVLLAGFDLGAPSPEGVSAWNLVTKTRLWSFTARGTGVSFDPGFPVSLGGGAGSIGIGQATRALNDSITGSVLFDATTGMNVTPGGTTIWRGMDFDESTGDLWLRRANDLVRATRTGLNSCIPAVVVDNGQNGQSINFQNVAFLNTAQFGDLVIYNDRSTSANGQAFALRVQVIDAQTGSSVAIDWGGFNPPAGPGAYDFAWDSNTNTLALLDFGARLVTIFQVGLAPPDFSSSCHGDGGDGMGCSPCPCGNDAPSGTVGGCLNSAGVSATLSASGFPSVSNDTLRFELDGATPNSFALLASGAALAPTNPANPCFGLGSGITPTLLDGLRCAVGGVIRHGTRATDATGSVGSAGGTPGWGAPDGPPGGLLAAAFLASGQTRYAQAFYRDSPSAGCGTAQNTSQAVELEIEP